LWLKLLKFSGPTSNPSHPSLSGGMQAGRGNLIPPLTRGGWEGLLRNASNNHYVEENSGKMGRYFQ